jgi:hypothetical protein
MVQKAIGESSAALVMALILWLPQHHKVSLLGRLPVVQIKVLRAIPRSSFAVLIVLV